MALFSYVARHFIKPNQLLNPPNKSIRSSGTSDGDAEEQWPPAEFGRRDGDVASSGPGGLFVDSDDEEEMRRRSSAAAATTTTATAAVNDAESGLLTATTASNGNSSSGSSGSRGATGYGSIPGEEGGGEEFKEEEQAVAAAGAEEGEGGAWCRMPSLPNMLIYGGFLLNMSTKGTIACFETLGAEYAMTHFDMTSAEAGSTFATFGTIGVVSFCVTLIYSSKVEI